jgi:large subunit ribosomal protein L10
MPRAEKVERVSELKERIEGSEALLLTEYRGLTVSDIAELRRSLAEGGTRFSVVKNTLMRRAAADASIELESLLQGPTAVAFVANDPVSAAKKVVDAAKRFPALILKGGFMEGRVLTADEAKGLADLDSREVMLSKIAGLVKGEMTRAAAALVSAQSKFLSLLEAYKDKLPASPEADDVAVEGEADAAVAEAPVEADAATEEDTPDTEASVDEDREGKE